MKLTNAKIIDKATSDINFIRHASSVLRALMMPAYVSATHKVFSKFRSDKRSIIE